MAKIGILTTYFASNFGAMLQPFALKRHLEMLGHDVEMIRYEQKTTYKFYNPWKPWVFKSFNLKKILSYLVNFPGLLKRDKTFKQFMWKHINPEKGFSLTIPQNKDYYFIGSDQIWTYKSPEGFDDVYFGNFPTPPNAIKVSYAASAEGIAYNEEQVAYLKKNIQNFDYVSVREKRLEEDMKRVTGRNDIVTVLDPTMLVIPSVYDEININNPCPNHSFIFFYCIRSCDHFINKLYDFANSIDAKMVIVSEMPARKYVRYCKSHKNAIYLPYAGVETFLGGIINAEYVFTPSFHGSVFSILYHKKFYTLKLNDNKMTRPTYLLTMLGIPDRLLSIDDEILKDDIDYSKVDRLLDEQRRFSRSFVLKVLNKSC